MNVLHITPNHAMKSSGVTTVVSQLVDQLINFDNSISITVASVGDHSVPQDCRIKVEMIPNQGIGRIWRWPYRLLEGIETIVRRNKIDVIHVHGIWREINLAGLEAGRRCNLPVVLSPHGMLEPWLWEQQGWMSRVKKKLYFNALVRRSLPDRLYIHAVTEMEKENLKGYFSSSSSTTIPNAIDFSQAGQSDDKEVDIDEPYILFLGRLHPKKGVDILLEAFADADLPATWALKIAGPEEVPSHVDELRAFVKQNHLEERVSFLGPVYGEEKQLLLKRAWALVAPSYSEVVGMVNLEAALCRTPSVTTYETGLWNWEQGGGVLIRPDVDSIRKALERVSSWTIDERNSRGGRSYEFVQGSYSWEAVLPKWKQLYMKVGSA